MITGEGKSSTLQRGELSKKPAQSSHRQRPATGLEHLSNQTPPAGRWRAPWHCPQPRKRFARRAGHSLRLLSTASLFFFPAAGSSQLLNVGRRTLRRRRSARPWIPPPARACARPPHCTPRAVSRAAPRPTPTPSRPNPHPGSPAARVSMATPPRRKKKKASGTSRLPPGLSEKVGHPEETSLFIFDFFRERAGEVMANLRHPTWRMESSPSFPRGSDAYVATSAAGNRPRHARHSAHARGYPSWRPLVPAFCALFCATPGAGRCDPGTWVSGSGVS